MVLPCALKGTKITPMSKPVTQATPQPEVKTLAVKPRNTLWEDLRDYALCILGGVIYAAAVNFFVVPLGLYIGNMTGVAQIIMDVARIFVPNLKDITGILLLGLNVPLFILSFSTINRKFFFKTLLTVLALTFALQIIPVRQIIPDLNDTLTLCVIGGLLAGFGAGLSLRSGGSAGGVDIIGVYWTMKNPNFSVGKVSLLISLLVYVYALFKFPLVVLVYSVIFTLICVFIIDMVHFQNVKIGVTIITHNKDVLPFITHSLQRGATYWESKGAWADGPQFIITTVVSKYELPRLRKGVMDNDPQAFMIENDSVTVTGNFFTHFF